MKRFIRFVTGGLLAAFFSSAIAQNPDYIRHPASLPCGTNTYVQTLGSVSGTPATCDGPIYYGTASGTNTYAVTASPVPGSYITGRTYVVTFTNANTSTATLNANTLGAKAIQKNGSALSGGDIPAGSTQDLVYDGTQFQLIGSSSGGGSGTVTTTGSPASGNLTKFSGATSITNADLAGDCTTSGTTTTTCTKINGTTPGGTCTNQFVTALSSSAVPTCTTATLAGAQFANQGTTSTVLHGNGSGNPSFGSIGTNDIAANAVTLPKLATQSDRTLVGNFSGGTAAPTAGSPDSFLVQSTYIATSTSGTATYTATAAPVPTAYVTGAQYSVTFTSTNTGASTLNLNSLGAKNIKLNGNAVAAGQIVGGATYQLIYDGTQFNISGSSASTTFVYPSVTSLLYGWSDSDDLITAPATAFAGFKTVLTTTGSGAGFSQFFEKGHPGAWQGGVGTTSGSGRVLLNFGAATTGVGVGIIVLDNGGGSDQVWYMKTDATLSNGTNRYSLRGGWSTDSFDGAAADRAVWIYTDNVNSGVFRISVSSNNVAQSDAVGTTTVLASTWYRMRLNIDPGYTTIKLYISVGTVSAGVTTWAAEYLDATYSGTMPRNNQLYCGTFSINRGTGAGNSSVSVDGWEAAVYLAAPRGGDLLPESVIPHHFKAANDEEYRIAA